MELEPLYHGIYSFTCQGTGVGNRSQYSLLNCLSVSPLYNIWYFLYIVRLFPVVLLVVISSGKEWMPEPHRRVHNLIRANVAIQSENCKLMTNFVPTRDLHAQRANLLRSILYRLRTTLILHSIQHRLLV